MQIRWTATENMLVDTMTKDMESDQLVCALRSGLWSIAYDPTLVKSKFKAAKKIQAVAEAKLPGTGVGETMTDKLNRFVRQMGWQREGGIPIHVARSASSYRTPEPRYNSSDYPIRSVFGLYSTESSETWRSLVLNQRYAELPNQHLPLTHPCKALVTFYLRAGEKNNVAAE
jgi:hypothetical protein